MMMKEHFKYGEMDNATLDNLMEGYQLIGPDWRYLYVNDAVVKHGKFKKKEDLVGHTMMEKYPGIEKTNMFKTLEYCMKKRVSTNLENEFTFPDGSIGWFELRVHPVPRGIFILSIDITERKRAEEIRKSYINSLEKMMYMTSHKVRQPVSNIMGISYMLNNSRLSRKDLLKIVGHMKTSIQSLDVFTRELVGFINKQKINH